MNARKLQHLVVGLSFALAAPVLTGAEGKGCGPDVEVGGEGECQIGGCSGQLCGEAGDELSSTCEWTDTYACYQELGVCERSAEGVCGWRPTEELEACIAAGGPDPEPEDCVIGGCSGQLCGEPGEDLVSDCMWDPTYACYETVGVCERNAEGVCDWRASDELAACLEDERVPATGACVRSSEDACTTDADCTTGGCGGELCHNPAVSEGITTCECTAPSLGCGCVFGRCSWFE